jgi:hypothetical protein
MDDHWARDYRLRRHAQPSGKPEVTEARLRTRVTTASAVRAPSRLIVMALVD